MMDVIEHSKPSLSPKSRKTEVPVIAKENNAAQGVTSQRIGLARNK